jgi:uncharacterized protein (TIGR03663 family)
VNTASTKSRLKQKRPQSANRAGLRKPNGTLVDTVEGEISERTFRISAAAILFVGALLRLVYLPLVPLHHDEGVNGNFLVPLVRNGTYTYDPSNYHGPTLYYFSAIFGWVARFFGSEQFRDAYGLTTFNVRFVTAAFGVATIGLALLLRKRLGAVGALSAAALIAISPGAVYLSRYFIHETLFVFFMFGIVVAAVKYYDSGAGVYLILAAISAALMTATKETWIINGPVLLLALLTTSGYFWLRHKLQQPAGISPPDRKAGVLDRFGGPISVATVALVSFTVFIVVNVLFYSSFFNNYPKGVSDGLMTLALWRKRTDEHVHPWSQYIKWLIKEEGIILMLGGLGALLALWRANNRFALFAAQWAFGLLAAYSLVGYKTPWIALNFIVPLALTSGYTLEVLYRKLCEFNQGLLFLAPAVLIVAFCGFQMYQLNFVHYDDDQYVYVYAHTRREMLVMLEQIEQVADRLAQMDRTGKITRHDAGIAIVSPEYWPLPWYFRDYKRVGYYQKAVATTEPIIIGCLSCVEPGDSIPQKEKLDEMYGAEYQQIDSSKLADPRIFPDRNPDGSFTLRPGVDLVLYVRRDMVKPAGSN